jgi:hypothetical protein
VLVSDAGGQRPRAALEAVYQLIAENASKRGRGTSETPVFDVVKREANVRARVMPNVNGANLRQALTELIDTESSTLMTDEWLGYRKAGRLFKGGHQMVNHKQREYSRDDAGVNKPNRFSR